MTAECPVLIVGAGPVGLALACDLRQRGVRCRIVDRADHPVPQAKAAVVHSRTLELLAKLGVAQAAVERGLAVSLLTVYSDEKRLIQIAFPRHLDGSSHPYLLMLPQHETEELLRDRLRGLGTTVEWHTELTAFSQDEGGIDAVVRTIDGDEPVRAGWLVGCDGAHSTVRHVLGLPFAGATFQPSLASFAVGEVRMTWDRSYREVFAFIHQGNFVAYFPMANGRHRVVIAWAPHDAPTGDVTLEEIQRAIETCGPAGAHVSEPTDLSRFQINQRRAQHYQCGRIFLVGDAAHIHSPIGGQGMNTGIQDAFNLGWKLALAVQGRASARLLGSYALEREQVGENLLRATDLTTHLALIRNPLLLALRDALTPRLFSSLPAPTRTLAGAIAELTIGYAHSTISVDERHRRAMLRAGDRAPDAIVRTRECEQAQSLFELFNSPHSVLLALPGGLERSAAERQWQALTTMLGGAYQDLIEAHLVTEILPDGPGRRDQPYTADQGALLLVRPDGYIGYRGDCGATEPLRRYLRTLFVPQALGF